MDKLQSSSIKTMGFGLTYKSIMKDRKLTIQAKAIYSYISSYAGAGDTAFPGRNLICHDLDINKDTYYRHFKYLLAYGYISVEQDRKENSFANNIYTLNEFPEKYTDQELIKEIESEKETKKKKKNNALVSEKYGHSAKQPSGEHPKNTDTQISDTQISDSNSNTPNNILLSIWDIAKDKLSKQLAEHTYNDFIATLTPFSYEDNVFIFLCPDEWLKTIIEMRYIDNIHMVLSEVCKLHNINDFSIQIKV